MEFISRSVGHSSGIKIHSELFGRALALIARLVDGFGPKKAFDFHPHPFKESKFTTKTVQRWRNYLERPTLKPYDHETKPSLEGK